MTSQLVIFRAFLFFRKSEKKSRKSTNKKFWPYWLKKANKYFLIELLHFSGSRTSINTGVALQMV